MNPEKLRKKTPAQLKKLADKVFSEYVRQRDRGTCISCGTQKPWKEMQAGHFVSRRHLATRWDEWNVHCQCVSCNVFLKGNMVRYAVALREKHGDNIIEILDKQSRISKPYKKADLLEIILKYTK